MEYLSEKEEVAQSHKISNPFLISFKAGKKSRLKTYFLYATYRPSKGRAMSGQMFNVFLLHETSSRGKVCL